MYSSGSTEIRNTVEPGSDWRFASGSSLATGEESGSNLPPAKDLLSTSPSPTGPREPNPHPPNLLLAEDNLPDALLIRQAIQAENLGCLVHAVEDGESVLKFLNAAEADPAAPHPDVMLLDLNLPKIEGLDVLRRVRANERWKNIPVMVVTSSDSPSDRGAARNLGAAYFRKPISYEEFMKLGGFLRKFLSTHGM